MRCLMMGQTKPTAQVTACTGNSSYPLTKHASSSELSLQRYLLPCPRSIHFAFDIPNYNGITIPLVFVPRSSFALAWLLVPPFLVTTLFCFVGQRVRFTASLFSLSRTDCMGFEEPRSNLVALRQFTRCRSSPFR